MMLARIILALCAAILLPASVNATPMRLIEDQTRLLTVPGAIGSVVLGNPSIADVAVIYSDTIALTGKTFGLTNIIVRDQGGGVLLDTVLQVHGGDGPVVRVRRGTEGTSYVCNGKCQIMTLQDLTPMPEKSDKNGSGEKTNGGGGPCMKADDRASDGSRCGGRSAEAKPGGQ